MKTYTFSEKDITPGSPEADGHKRSYTRGAMVYVRCPNCMNVKVAYRPEVRAGRVKCKECRSTYIHSVKLRVSDGREYSIFEWAVALAEAKQINAPAESVARELRAIKSRLARRQKEMQVYGASLLTDDDLVFGIRKDPRHTTREDVQGSYHMLAEKICEIVQKEASRQLDSLFKDLRAFETKLTRVADAIASENQSTINRVEAFLRLGGVVQTPDHIRPTEVYDRPPTPDDAPAYPGRDFDLFTMNVALRDAKMRLESVNKATPYREQAEDIHWAKENIKGIETAIDFIDGQPEPYKLPLIHRVHVTARAKAFKIPLPEGYDMPEAPQSPPEPEHYTCPTAHLPVERHLRAPRHKWDPKPYVKYRQGYEPCPIDDSRFSPDYNIDDAKTWPAGWMPTFDDRGPYEYHAYSQMEAFAAFNREDITPEAYQDPLFGYPVHRDAWCVLYYDPKDPPKKLIRYEEGGFLPGIRALSGLCREIELDEHEDGTPNEGPDGLHAWWNRLHRLYQDRQDAAVREKERQYEAGILQRAPDK